MKEWGSPKKTPVIECSKGNLLLNPTLRELAEGAGVWRHCPEKHVDLAIIGAGPAGMTAAVYAASEGLSTLVIDRLGPGGQAAGSSKIENFIGFPSGLSGAELAMRSVLQMLKFGAKIAAPVNVNSIEISKSPKDCHVLHLDCGTAISAGTVLLAAGVAWRRLDVPGAERFEGSGIHHACTSVEAMLFDNLDVAVVGAGNSAGQAAMFLSECCAFPPCASAGAAAIGAGDVELSRQPNPGIAKHCRARRGGGCIRRRGAPAGERLAAEFRSGWGWEGKRGADGDGAAGGDVCFHRSRSGM